MCSIINLFDTIFTNCNLSEACFFIETEINKKNNFKYFAIKDVALTVRSLEDYFLNSFYKLYPEKIFIDGKGLLFTGKILHKEFKEMFGGPGLYYEIISRSEKENYSCFFLGASEEVLKKAILNIKLRHPKLNIVGFINGYFTEKEEEDIVIKINNTKCDILFLGISTPKRELFIQRNLSKFNPMVCIPVGGVFDNEANITKFAPKLIANLGMEWIYRVAQEPKRLARRYFYTHTKYFYYLLKEILK
jgi:N-acetylglucosaminyldiphosphoundecaprenol N-acetyl-beta-D-mannosaminyltransferase